MAGIGVGAKNDEKRPKQISNQTEVIETNDTKLNTITVIENENLESVLCITEPVKQNGEQYSHNNNDLPVKENEICNEEKESANESSEIKASVAHQESTSSPLVKSEHRIDHTSCMFVKAQIGNKTLQFLIDTGSPVSVLKKNIHDNLQLNSLLTSADKVLYTANGNRLEIFGKSKIEFVVGNYKLEQEFIIGNFDSIDGILGTDFLEKNDCDIMIRKKKLN